MVTPGMTVRGPDAREVIAFARELRATSADLRAMFRARRRRWNQQHHEAQVAVLDSMAVAGAAMAPVYRQRHRPIPRMFRRAHLAGGASPLVGRRILLVTEDAEDRKSVV